MNKHFAKPLLALSLALSGCGGGSGSGGGVVSTPVTPTFNYTKLVEMGGDRTFQTAGVHVTNTATGFSGITADEYGSGVVVGYGADSDTYTLTAPGRVPVTFFPTDLNAAQSSPNSLTYNKSPGVNSLRLTVPTVNGVVLSYTLLGSWSTLPAGSSSVTTYLAVGGSPTQAGDMPRTGTANYALGVGGTAVVPNGTGGGTGHFLAGGSTGTFSANFGTGAISTSLHLVGNGGTDFGTFTGSGALASGTASFSGTFAGATGAFAGAFFGPQASEMGMAYGLETPNFSAMGLVSGVKQ